jgi:hypothetical protein
MVYQVSVLHHIHIYSYTYLLRSCVNRKIIHFNIFLGYQEAPKMDNCMFWSTDKEIQMEEQMYLELEAFDPFGG